MKNISATNPSDHSSEGLDLFKDELQSIHHKISYFVDILEDLKYLTIGEPKRAYEVARLVKDLMYFKNQVHDLSSQLTPSESASACNQLTELEDPKSIKGHPQNAPKDLKELRNEFKIYSSALMVFVGQLNQLECGTS